MSTVSRREVVPFEILRNRLWAITNEAAAVLRVLSGSPVTSDARDFNTCLINAKGDGTLMGPYVASHGIGQPLVVQHIVREYQTNPGISEGDMFICSDPYVGPPHQNDVTIVAPVHWEGEVVAWFGATLHQVDVGGPVEGSQTAIGAESIYGEPLPMPPLKIIEGGLLRKDIEAECLIRSRTREAYALDMRAQIGCINAANKRIKDVIARYGVTMVKESLEQISEHTATLLKARLRELPDGVWHHTGYLDYEDTTKRLVYPCRVVMTKQGESLTFDYSQTASQAPAMINCTYSGLLSGVLMGVFTHLCFDIPWSPAGVLRVLKITSRPGTLVHAQWPAGASKGTTGAGWLVTQTAAVCLSKMLASDEKYRSHVMAGWCGNVPVLSLFGLDQRGEYFGGPLMDHVAGGGGAKSFEDGVDTAGYVRCLSISIGNAETQEVRYPLLYLFRRQERDTGGAGKWRGGAGIGVMFVPYDVERIDKAIVDTWSYNHPEAIGNSGGGPGASNQFVIARDSAVRKMLQEGVLPSSIAEVGGSHEVIPNFLITSLGRDDAFYTRVSGGGGYGDPLDREPEDVLADVVSGLVSKEAAADSYGVVMEEHGWRIDRSRTIELRSALKDKRRQEGRIVGSQMIREIAQATSSRTLSEYMSVVDGAVKCRCGRVLVYPTEDERDQLLVLDRPVGQISSLLAANPNDTPFMLREIFCPSCLTRLEAEVYLVGS